jgi:cytochrome c
VAEDRSVRLWRVDAPEPRSLAGLVGAPISLAVSPDGRSAAAGAADGSVRLWDLASGRGRQIEGPRGPVQALAFVDGGRALAVAGPDGALRIHPDDLPHEAGALRAWLARMAPPPR